MGISVKKFINYWRDLPYQFLSCLNSQNKCSSFYLCNAKKKHLRYIYPNLKGELNSTHLVLVSHWIFNKIFLEFSFTNMPKFPIQNLILNWVQLSIGKSLVHFFWTWWFIKFTRLKTYALDFQKVHYFHKSPKNK